MTLALFEHNNNEIRVTEDKRFSVYDVLIAFEVCDKLSNAKNVLDRIQHKHFEVSTFCSNFKFPGRGQRLTPVADEEGIYQILMLCPGKRGAEFRKWVAGILADPNKAAEYAIKKWEKRGKSQSWIKKRLEGMIDRHEFTDTLKEHGINQGHEFARCTNAIYRPLLGGTAQEIKQSRQLTKNTSLRDDLSSLELTALSLAEQLAERDIKADNLKGIKQIEPTCSNAGAKVRSIL